LRKPPNSRDGSTHIIPPTTIAGHSLGDEAVALARLHELCSRNADRWLGGLREWGGRVTFRRGLIEARSELGPLRELERVAPPDAPPWLETLDFRYGQQKWIGDLVESEAVRRFSGLEVTSVRFTEPWLRRLGGGLYAPRLRRLRLSLSKDGPQKPLGEALAAGEFGGLRSLELEEDVSDAAVSALAAAPWLAGLTSFAGRRFSKALLDLARSPHAPRLTRLHLDHVQPGKGAMQKLASSPLLERVVDLRLSHAGRGSADGFAGRDWPRLRKLSLASNPLGEYGFRDLAKVRGFAALKSLDVRYTLMGRDALRAVLACPWVAGLERLDLNGPFGDADAESIADCPDLGGLRHLELHGEGIGAAGIRALFSSRKLGALQTLVLSTKGRCELDGIADGGLPSLTALALRAGVLSLSSRGGRALASSSIAPRLRRLDLCQCDLTAQDVAELAVPAFAGLTSLDLADNRGIGDAGALALARMPWPNLARLNVSGCGFGAAGVQALFRPEAFPALVVLRLLGIVQSPADLRPLLDWPRLPGLALCWALQFGPYPEELRRLTHSPAFPDRW
jgi:hypothetical protein